MDSKASDKKAVVPVTPAIDRNAILAENREIAKGMWSGKLSANEQKALNNICLLYGLDPLQKQIVSLGGNIYVTKSGLLNIAHADENPPDGIEVVPATAEERKNADVPESSHYWKAVIYKRGSARPFTEYGEANSGNVRIHNADWRVISDMAKTRAVNRALRNAYRVGLTSVEEMPSLPQEPVTHGEYVNGAVVAEPDYAKPPANAFPAHGSAVSTPFPSTPKINAPSATSASVDDSGGEFISKGQVMRLFAIAKQVALDKDMLRNYLIENYGIEHTNQIKVADYDNIIRWVEDYEK